MLDGCVVRPDEVAARYREVVGYWRGEALGALLRRAERVNADRVALVAKDPRFTYGAGLAGGLPRGGVARVWFDGDAVYTSDPLPGCIPMRKRSPPYRSPRSSETPAAESATRVTKGAPSSSHGRHRVRRGADRLDGGAPAGQRPGKPGLHHTHWTDMRPKSLIEAMARAEGGRK